MWEGIRRRKANLIIPASSYSYFSCSSLALIILTCQLAGQTDRLLDAKHCSQRVFWTSLFSALHFQGSASMANIVPVVQPPISLFHGFPATHHHL